MLQHTTTYSLTCWYQVFGTACCLHIDAARQQGYKRLVKPIDNNFRLPQPGTGQDTGLFVVAPLPEQRSSSIWTPMCRRDLLPRAYRVEVTNSRRANQHYGGVLEGDAVLGEWLTTFRNNWLGSSRRQEVCSKRLKPSGNDTAALCHRRSWPSKTPLW